MGSQKNANPDVRKIIFTGLDNAGKTSIILSLLREISKIAPIKPTRNAERRTFEFLGTNISEWDLGGHERYRESYLKKAGKIFRDTDIVIYVVDVQDHDRADDSCTYLKKVVNKFIELGIEPSIHIFFHKFDPNMEDKQQAMDITYRVLKDRIDSFQNYENFIYHKTSVYNLFTIVNAMSELLLNLFPRAYVIDTTIQEFAKKCKVEGVELLDDNSLIIGSYYKEDLIKELLNSISPYFLRMNDGFEKLGSEGAIDNNIVVQRFGKHFIFKRFELIKGASPYYLLVCKDDPSFNNDDFVTLINLLNEVLSTDF